MNLITKRVWVDGRLVEWHAATTHLLTHGLHYGSGAFDGIRAYQTADGPVLFRLEDHMRRFLSSAAWLAEVPYSVETLCSAAADLIKTNGLEEGYVRPLMVIGCKGMGMDITGMPVVVSISCWRWGAYLGGEGLRNGVRCGVASWRRTGRAALPPEAKLTGKYVNSLMAKMEVVKKGLDEAIMLNEEGHVAEGPGENIFLVRDGVVITPDAGSDILPGITRDSVITIARDRGYRVEERPVSLPELLAADEAFFTGTAAEVTPIREIDHQPIGSGSRGPVTTQLQALFFDAVRGKNHKYRRWLYVV